jgi:hypothetical protein
MRRFMVLVAAASVAACGGKEQLSDELRNDLALATSAEALELATPASASTAVVGEIEQIAPRTRTPAPSARARQPRRAPRQQTPAAPQVTEQQEIEYASAAPVPRPVDDRGPDGMGESAILAGRPEQVEASGSGTARGSGGGPSLGTILAGVGIAVIRGGVIMGDVHCPPRRPRGGGTYALPNESGGGGVVTIRGIPVGRGTFPGRTMPGPVR